MADYQLQLDILVNGIRQVDALGNRLNEIENTVTAIERRWNTASAAFRRADILLRATGTSQPRTAGGQFAPDPDRAQRLLAYGEQRRARAEQFMARRELGRAAGQRTVIANEIQGAERINRQLERRIYLESRLNSAASLYRTQLQKFSRGGGGTRLSEELQGQARSIQQAFEVATAGGTRNLSIVRSLATEMGRIVEAQNEINRGSTVRSKAFYQEQDFNRTIQGLRQRGAPQSAFGTIEQRLTEFRSAAQRGSQFEIEDASRRIREALARVARDIDAGERLIRDSIRNAPSSPIQGGVNFPGSPIFQQTPFLERRFGRRTSAAISEGLIGGAFPLLFGQGPLAALGGGLGGAAGGFAGGGLGFGLSLLGTGAGQAMSTFAASAIEAGKSLRDPIANLQKLADAGLLASKGQEQLIKNLIEFGRSSEAASIVQQELAKKIGVLGLRDMANLGDSSIRLSKAWGELTVQLQAAIAGPLAGLLDWTASMVALFTGGNRKNIERQNLLESLPPDKRKELLNRLQSDPYGATGRSEASLFGEYQRFRRPMALPPANLSPEQQQADFDKQLQLRREEEDRTYRNAKEVEDLRRETISQQRQFEDQSIALQRQSWDLQRRVNDDIFNKQQQIQQQQISLDKAKKQVAIEIVDIEYQKRIANEEGRAAEVLAAEAELMRVRSTNEAEIESKKKMLELEIAKQKRETENYVYQLAREADGIRRATLKYELDVADYKYKREQQVDEINRRRIRENEDAQIRQDRMTGGGVSGRGQIVEYLTGDTSHPGYRADHGGSNYHEHLAFQTKLLRDTAMAILRGAGIQIGSINTGKHAPGSYHYQDLAFDIPASQVPVGQERALSARVRQILGKAGFSGMGIGGAGASATPVAPQLSPPAAQLSRSSANAVRPQIAGIPVSGVGNQFTGMDAKEAEIQRKDIAFQEQLAKLGEQRTLNRVLEIAEGEKGLKQKQSELDNAESQLQVIGAYSQNQQESLSFEAESLQKIKERMDVDAEILKNTKLQGKEREQLEEALGRGLVNTQKQIDLDRQLLQIAQQTRYAKDVASLEMQLRTQGAGVAAGFSGSAAQRYVQELQLSGNEAQASNLAQLQKQLDFESEIISIKDNLNQLLDPIYQVREGAKSIGSAFGESFKETISGSMSAQEALANFFQKTADHFLEMAAQIVAQQTVLKLLNYGLSFLPGFAGAGASGAGIGTADFSGAIAIGGARAFGGPVNAYTPYMVGEKGPELFVPSSSGNVVPNSSLGGGSVSVMVNVDAKGSQVQGDDAKSSELGRLIAASVQQELVKQQRPGGILAR